jgi:prophage antirepressor-like protein
MDIVVNIPSENDNKNQTQLLIQQFKHFNIEIYGTYEDPLFKANDIGYLLGIKRIGDTIKDFDNDQKSGVDIIDPHGRLQNTNMLTEEGFTKNYKKITSTIACYSLYSHSHISS